MDEYNGHHLILTAEGLAREIALECVKPPVFMSILPQYVPEVIEEYRFTSRRFTTEEASKSE